MPLARHTRRLLLLLTLCAAPSTARAQLRHDIPDLFSFGNCGAPLCLNSTVVASTIHGSHYIASARNSVGDLIGFLGSAIALGVSSVPISAATSAATFEFKDGVLVEGSGSSGPIFGERVQTLAKGRAVIGLNTTAADFRSVRGVPLDDLTFRFVHQNVADTAVLGDPPLENDVIEVNTSLNVNLQVASLYFNYGLTDRVEVGIAVPMVRVGLNGGSIARVLPFSYPTPHFFGTAADPSLSAASSIDGSASGFGDVSGRLKFNLGGTDRRAIGLLIDARFPTGDEAQFLGSGEYAVRGLGIVSARYGNFSPHLNVGYQWRSGNSITDAVLATAGFDQLVASWATLAVDVITQWQAGTSPVELPDPIEFQEPVIHNVRQTNIPNRKDHLIDGSLGFKLRIGSGVTALTNVLVPLNSAGIRSSVVGTFGLEYGF